MTDDFRKQINSIIGCVAHGKNHCKHCNWTKGRRRHKDKILVHKLARRRLNNIVRKDIEKES